jgi:parallel beta-helix repeat protein
VNGSLVANSTNPSQRITFTGATATPGFWGGIKINSGSSTNVSTLRRSDVTYATTGITVTYTGNTNNVTIDKCRINNNSGFGIKVAGNSYPSATVHPLISNSKISNNYTGIYLGSYAKPTITTNRIESNGAYGIHGSSSCSDTVRYNYISGNGNYGFRFAINSNAVLGRNSIISNSGGGVYCSASSNLFAYGIPPHRGRNYIVGNTGDGIYSTDSSPHFGRNLSYEWGYNEIHGNTSYQARQVSSGQLLAEQNYWAGEQADISGNVDNSP